MLSSGRQVREKTRSQAAWSARRVAGRRAASRQAVLDERSGARRADVEVGGQRRRRERAWDVGWDELVLNARLDIVFNGHGFLP